MRTIELKTSLHEIIDRIHDEQLLRSFYYFMKAKERSEPGKLWDSLTESQKREVFLSYEDAEHSEELVDRETVFDDKKPT